MATSNSSNYVTTRDDIIKRALRIIGALGQGETPITAAVTEAAQALNDILKEWAADGMHLWKYGVTAATPTIGQGYVQIGNSSNFAYHKINSAFRRTGTGTSILDVPLILLTHQEYDSIPNKLAPGTPTHFFYTKSNTLGTNVAPTQTNYLYLWPVPDANFVTTNSGTILVRAQWPFHDFDSSSDNPDMPPYLYNALVWALAEQLAFEYGVPIAERAQITKKAQTHKAIALSFDQEEGSIFFQPAPNWGNQ